MKILVTGASGFIGSNLVRLLLDRGESVRVFLRPASNKIALEGLDVEVVYGDVTNVESFRNALKGCKQLYHCAGKVDLGISQGEKHNIVYRVNVEGTINAARLAMEEGIEKMVFTSTSETIGWGSKSFPADEKTKYNLSYFHIASVDTKYTAEQKLMEYHKNDGLNVVIVNPTICFGEWDTKPTTGRILQAANYNLLHVYPDGGTNIIDVKDVAQGHILAMEKGKAGERYILANENLSYLDLFTMINEELAKSRSSFRMPFLPAVFLGYLGEVINTITPVETILSSNFIRYSYITNYVNGEKAFKQLGLKVSPVREAIRRQIKWMRDYHYL